MDEQRLHTVVANLRRVAGGPAPDGSTDQDLLQQFIASGDENAFALLLKRHGPMVRAVCRRLLHQASDIDDAFQTVFLILACRARSIQQRQSLAGWLHGVAYHTAQRACRDAIRRRRHEQQVMPGCSIDPAQEAAWQDVCLVLDQELARLPEKQRAALVLCHLQGHTCEEAARQLGQSLRTLERRLEQGRAQLRQQLTRRGLTLSAALLPIQISGELLPSALTTLTVSAAPLAAAGTLTASGLIRTEVITLLKGMLNAMLRNKLQFVLVAILSVGLLGTAAGVLLVSARARTAEETKVPARVDPKPAAVPEVYALLLIGDRQTGPWPKGLPMPEREDQAQFRRTQVAMLHSRVILQAALKQKGIMDLGILPKDQNALSWLEENLVTEYLDNTELLRVSFTKRVSSEKPEEQAKLLNTIVMEYVTHFGSNERSTWSMRHDDLKKVIQKRQETLKEEHKHLRAMRNALALGISKPEAIASLRETLQQQEKEFRQLSKEIVGIEARIKFRKESRGDTTQLREDLAVFQAQQPFLAEQVSILRNDLNKRLQPPLEVTMKEEAIAVQQRFLERLQEEEEVIRQVLESSLSSRIQIVAEADAEKAGK